MLCCCNALFIHNWVGEVDIFLIHAFFRQTYRFAETLEMHNFPFPQETDYIVNIRVVR